MKRIFKGIIKSLLPYYKQWTRYAKTKQGGSYWNFLKFKCFSRRTYWYRHKNFRLANPRKIDIGYNSLIGQSGNYIQGAGHVHIGNYVQFATNIGILSANHDLYDQNKYNYAPIKIGDYSWVGMNAVITAGVELGPRTIVAAGAVVTKSFPDGFCVLAGVPAKVIKHLDKDKFKPWFYEEEWYGYLTKEQFEKKRRKYLDI